jgi:hypothetical protein
MVSFRLGRRSLAPEPNAELANAERGVRLSQDSPGGMTSSPIATEDGAAGGDGTEPTEDGTAAGAATGRDRDGWLAVWRQGLALWAAIAVGFVLVPAGHPVELGLAVSAVLASPMVPFGLYYSETGRRRGRLASVRTWGCDLSCRARAVRCRIVVTTRSFWWGRGAKATDCSRYQC